jgi:hypothetical protein
MGIKGRNEKCGIENKYIKFDAITLFNWVYLGQVSL